MYATMRKHGFRIVWVLISLVMWTAAWGKGMGLSGRAAESPPPEHPGSTPEVVADERKSPQSPATGGWDFLSPGQVQAARAQPELPRPIADLVPPVYRDLVTEIARQYDLDARLLAAVISQESRWNPRLVSGAGDAGLMQIIPGTARWIASRLRLENYDLFDPRTNMEMGAWFLSRLVDQYGNWPQALAAYNGGPRAADRGAEFPYTVRILQLYHPTGTTALAEGTAAGRQAGPLQ